MDDRLTGSPRAIKDILFQIAKDQGWEEKLNEVEIPACWKKSVDDRIYKITKIHKFTKGTLYIHTESPTWRYELNLREKGFRADMNKLLGKEVIKKIIFK
jgi:predicted nucleic acid-binding Zn ribbon protein